VGKVLLGGKRNFEMGNPPLSKFFLGGKSWEKFEIGKVGRGGQGWAKVGNFEKIEDLNITIN
jgi:hypothetical protein